MAEAKVVPLRSLALAALLALAHATSGSCAATGPDADAASGTVVLRIDDRITRYDLGEDGTYLYHMPSRWDWILKPIPDMGTYAKETFRLRNTYAILGVVASTLVLMRFDQDIVDAVQRGGDKIGIAPNVDKTRTLVSIGKAQFRVPSDIGSALYFLGDGWTHLTTGAVILGWGLVHDDSRAVQTGSQVFEAVLASGGVTQIIKHVTGHEDPYKATKPGGRWRLFPNQKDYFKNVSSYDAFPSGHLATAMATVTVIAENYPEKTCVRPVGYTLMTLLGLQMMNNGVHWASDYPLALALGYGFGEIAVRQGREAVPPAHEGEPGAPPADLTLRSRLHPALMAGDGGALLAGVRYSFRR